MFGTSEYSVPSHTSAAEPTLTVRLKAIENMPEPAGLSRLPLAGSMLTRLTALSSPIVRVVVLLSIEKVLRK